MSITWLNMESVLRLWQHDETGRMCWRAEAPSPRWSPVPLCYEDELPEGISDEEYAVWFTESMVVDGVRMGPRMNP